MKLILYSACLLLTWAGAWAQEGDSTTARSKEPTGGIVDIALKPSDLGEGWTRWVRLVLDPKLNPSTWYRSKYELPGRPAKPLDPVDPALPYKRELDRAGAEAAIYLAYSSRLYVKILRFPTTKEVEDHWVLRQQTGESELVSSAGVDVLSTKPGKQLRSDLRASMATIECRADKYLIRVAPALPLATDPGFNFVLKQVEKIRNLSEPAGAANRSQPGGSQTNQTSSAAASGR